MTTKQKKQLLIELSIELPILVVLKFVCLQLMTGTDRLLVNLILNHFHPKWYTNQLISPLHGMIHNYWCTHQNAPSIDTVFAITSNLKFLKLKDKLHKIAVDIYLLKDKKFDHQYIRDCILKYIKSRAIYTTILDNIDYIQNNNDVSRIIPSLLNTMKIGFLEDIGTDYFENIQQHINLLQAKEARTPFLWKNWDRYTYGGIPKDLGCLFMIMAKPGLGKSQVLMNIGYNWLQQNKNVLMISLEMSLKMYSSRMSALFSDICVNLLSDNTLILQKKLLLFKKSHNSKLIIKQYSPNEFNSTKLKNLMEKLQQSKDFKPDLIIVDYLNIMATNGPSYHLKSYLRVGNISKLLRAVSVETKIPILSATQTNRSGSGGYSTEDISMSDTSDSASINMDADALFALFQMDGDRLAGRLNVKILKNRLGGFVDSIFLMYSDYTTLKITDWDDNDYDDDLPIDILDKLLQEKNKQLIDSIFNIE